MNTPPGAAAAGPATGGALPSAPVTALPQQAAVARPRCRPRVKRAVSRPVQTAALACRAGAGVRPRIRRGASALYMPPPRAGPPPPPQHHFDVGPGGHGRHAAAVEQAGAVPAREFAPGAGRLGDPGRGL